MIKKIDENEAFKIIEKFNNLNASRAPIKDFLEIVDPQRLVIKMRNTDIRFEGIAGFADHQIGKLIFFDQKFDCDLLGSKITEDNITIETKGTWYAKTWQSPDAYSRQLIGDLKHTWVLEKQIDSNKLLIVKHICEYFSYRDGYSPNSSKQDFHLDLE